MMNADTSVNVAFPNQTNTNATTIMIEPMIVVFQFLKMRSIIVFRFCVVRAGIEYRGTLCK